MIPQLDEFLTFDDSAIRSLVAAVGFPQLGVFVPDGSRRLVLSFTDVEPDTEEYYRLSATLPAEHLLAALSVFFDCGLPILLVPILSSSVLRRGSEYRQLTALTGLQLLFDSPAWRDFYHDYDIRVAIYGNPDLLVGTECEPALGWIRETCSATASHATHVLYFAIGESPSVGDGIADLGIEFFRRNGRAPSLPELMKMVYGAELPPADFFIMTSKISGMGALPRFVVNGDTRIYFLPSAGAMGLNAQTYRTILHDMIYNRDAMAHGYHEGAWTDGDRTILREYYQRSVMTVIGVNERLGNVAVPKW